jgi:ABC-2 type transport system permease protein
MSFLLSSVTVYIRDLEYFISVLMMLWFYVTPVLYSIDMIPDKFRNILMLNPMTLIITSYREILYYKK